MKEAKELAHYSMTVRQFEWQKKESLQRLGKNLLIQLKRQALAGAYANRSLRGLVPPQATPSLGDVTSRSNAEPNTTISTAIRDRKPFMAGRFGSFEIGALARLHHKVRHCQDWQEVQTLVRKKQLWRIFSRAYVYPYLEGNAQATTFLVRKYLESMPELDLLASWAPGESYFEERLANSAICDLPALEPYFHDVPWSSFLSGMRVLVVHPFTNSIRHQLKTNRERIFSNPNVLPEFDFTLIRPHMDGLRAFGGTNGFQGMYEELLEEVFSASFDVAIVGSGTTGLPLAADIKRAGLAAIHLGGATQLLFGIKGKRWDDVGFPLYNDSWIRPLPDDTPERHRLILDRGAYW